MNFRYQTFYILCYVLGDPIKSMFLLVPSESLMSLMSRGLAAPFWGKIKLHKQTLLPPTWECRRDIFFLFLLLLKFLTFGHSLIGRKKSIYPFRDICQHVNCFATFFANASVIGISKAEARTCVLEWRPREQSGQTARILGCREWKWSCGGEHLNPLTVLISSPTFPSPCGPLEQRWYHISWACCLLSLFSPLSLSSSSFFFISFF